MTRFSPGDVVLIRFPFTDFSGSKKRPALVVSSEAYHAFRGDCIMMLITSKMQGEPYGYTIQNWHEAGLLKPSYVKPVVMTVEASVIEKKLGALPLEEFSLVRTQLLSFIFATSH